MNGLKTLRKTLLLTQSQLAAQLGVSRSAISMWETSKQLPDYYMLKKIEALFNVPPDFIAGCGVFKDWDVTEKYFADVVGKLKQIIPGTLEMPNFDDERFLIAWLDMHCYSRENELQIVRWFAFAVKRIEITPREDEWNEPFADVEIELTQNMLTLVQWHSFVSHESETVVPISQVWQEFMEGDEQPEETAYPIRIPVLKRLTPSPCPCKEDVVGWEILSSERFPGSSEYVGLKIPDDVMTPMISRGDVAIIRKQTTIRSGEIAVLSIDGSDAAVVRALKTAAGIVLIPGNSANAPVFYSNEDMKRPGVAILGRVLEVRKKV